MDKEDVVHIFNRILLSHRKEQNNAICRNIDTTRDIHSKWSQSERQILYDIIYIWNLKDETNEPIYETERLITGWWLPRGRGLGEGWVGGRG